MELRDDLLLRLAGGKVLSRPGFADMNPSSTGNAVSRSVTSGNPTFDPVTAAQADIALEWYFSDYAIASIGVFKKWGQGFIDVDVREQTLTEIDPTTNQPFVLNVQRPVNGDDADISGVELNYQQTFSELPDPFDGLGVIFNYTYLDTNADFKNALTGASYGVRGLSENTINLTDENVELYNLIATGRNKYYRGEQNTGTRWTLGVRAQF